MKRSRSLRGWCGLGLAVAAVAGGAYASKRYAEQHMLSSVLGSGVHAQSVTWHWRQSAGCAEQVEIPLPYATDDHDQALQLYAPKLWFVYDQAALLRKRFVLPRVVIEDAIISNANKRQLAQQIVDIDFGPSVDMADLSDLSSMFELPNNPSSGDSDTMAYSTDQPDLPVAKASGRTLKWLDTIQSLCDSMQDDKTLLGRQVACDADMLSERIQAEYANSRLQAQQLIAEARDLHQQVANTDNVLRQPRLAEFVRRLEIIREELKRLKSDVDHSDKRLDEQHSRLRSALLIEKKQLLRQAEEYQAPPALEVAEAFLAQMVNDRLLVPNRAVVLMADLMRKPLDAMSAGRGEQMRYLDHEQPELAARSASIVGKMDIDGAKWPFKAQGSFEVLTAVGDEQSSQDTPESLATFRPSGSSKWQMTIDTQAGEWQLDGQCPRVDGPCAVKLTSAATDGLNLECEVIESKTVAKGQINFKQLVQTPDDMSQLAHEFASSYRCESLIRQLMMKSLVADDSTPKLLEFNSAPTDLPGGPTGQPSACQMQGEAIDWLSNRMQAAATTTIAEMCRQASGRLETLIAARLTDQKGMAATLRRDAEQYVVAQQEELRRIQASVNGMMEQMQTNNYFARQPGEMPR